MVTYGNFKFNIVKQVVYNNEYVKFATMYYAILSSLYQSASFPWERVRVYIDQFFENGQLKRPME